MKWILTLLLLLTVSCSTGDTEKLPIENSKQEIREQQRATPKREKLEPVLRSVTGDRPKPVFSEVIDARVEQAGLSDLRNRTIDDNDVEFRIWIGFGKKPLEGFVFRRHQEKWQGQFLQSINLTTKPPHTIELSAPRSGWEELWDDLLDSEILTLPDSSQLKGGNQAFDGTSYVIEIKKDGNYRTYHYSNPDFQEWKEAKQILKIANTLYSEFDLRRIR